jgi:Filamin/ABP280 repeat
VTAEIVDDEGKKVPVEVVDHNDGTYDATFTVHKEGTCCLKVKPQISALQTLPCLSDHEKLTVGEGRVQFTSSIRCLIL